jgi:6-pyruvoyl-tetrahydropterin synthase
MNIAELKLEIIRKIIATDDEALLNKIQEIINDYESNSLVNEPTTTYERIRVFSEEEQRKINLAIQQYENGECISDEEAQKEIQECLEDEFGLSKLGIQEKTFLTTGIIEINPRLTVENLIYFLIPI